RRVLNTAGIKPAARCEGGGCCMRRQIGVVLVALAAVLAALGRAPAGEDKMTFAKKTYVFKTVGATKVEADVYRAADTKVRPVLVWIHGGALIVGSRAGVPKDLLDL